MTTNAQNSSFPGQPDPSGLARRGRPLRIAMIGQKGLPATHGGVERHVEEIGARLATFGHDVTVYCRPTYSSSRGDGAADGSNDADCPAATDGGYRGLHLRPVAALGTKHLDTITHSARSTAAAMRMRPDIVHYHALGPGLVAPVPRVFSRARVVLTVHGLDNERAKWGWKARSVLDTAHWMSAHVPDVTVVVSRALVDHYAGRFGRETVYVPNGVEVRAPRPPGPVLSKHRLTPGGYLLFVGRLVPEKSPDLLIRAYRAVPGDVRLVIAGGSSFTDGYVATLRRLADEDRRVVLTGYIYGDQLAELYSNAAAFVLPSHLEGMALTLLEAISFGLPVVASDIAPNREVAAEGPGYRLFHAGDARSLAAELGRMAAGGPLEKKAALLLRERVLAEHSWDIAADRMQEIYRGLVRTPANRRHPPRPFGGGREPAAHSKPGFCNGWLSGTEGNRTSRP